MPEVGNNRALRRRRAHRNRNRKFVGSPLEEGGLELPVPLRDTRPITGTSHTCVI
jgi:hypothetical protein